MEVVQVERRQRTTKSRRAATTSYSRRSRVASLADAYLGLARIVNHYQNGAGSTRIVVDNIFDSPQAEPFKTCNRVPSYRN